MFKNELLINSHKHQGMLDTLEEAFPETRYKRCAVRLYCNVLSKLPKQRCALAAGMPKARYAKESLEVQGSNEEDSVTKLDGLRLKEAAAVVRKGCLKLLNIIKHPIPGIQR